MPKRQPLSKNGLRLLALIAFRDGEITEERCCEIIGCSRNEVRDEMHKRCGKFNPYTETCNELESANRELERLRALLGEAYVVLKRSELVASFALCPRLKKDIESLIARIAKELEGGK